MLSSLAGMAALFCFGPGDAAAAVGVGFAALLMLSCRALHPPAGIDAFLVAQLGLPLAWVVNPVLIGALLLAAFSRLWAAVGHHLLEALPIAAKVQRSTRDDRPRTEPLA